MPIAGLPPRRQLSEAELAQRAERERQDRLARDQRNRARRRLHMTWTALAMAGAFWLMHAVIGWATDGRWSWTIGSAIVGAGCGLALWSLSPRLGWIAATAGGIGWILLAWAIGWAAPFAGPGGLVAALVGLAHYVIALGLAFLVDLIERELMQVAG